MNKADISMFRFPSREKDLERRKKWIQAVRRIKPGGEQWSPNKNARICSEHFVGTRPIYHPDSPSYTPTIFPSQYRKSQVNENNATGRFLRAQKRRLILSEIQREANHNDFPQDEQAIYPAEANNEIISVEISIQCDFDDINEPNDAFQFICEHNMNDVGTMALIPREKIRCETPPTKSTCSTQCGPTSKTVFFSAYSSLINSKDDTVSLDLCGVTLQVFAVLLSLFQNKNKKRNEIGIEDKLMLFLMKMKLGLSFTAIGALFSVHRTTASRIFTNILFHFSNATKDWITWLPKQVVQHLLPPAFKEFYPTCRVIIDCFEVKTEIPSAVRNQNLLYSQYKSAHTAKFFIGIAPNGGITFISNGYGGRSSDAAITIDCGILNLLEPGDLVMADRGFPTIKTSCDVADAILVMPPFSENSGQFTEEQMDTTFKVASVRIHVERMIQRVKIYNILNNIIPMDLIPHVDEIV